MGQHRALAWGHFYFFYSAMIFICYPHLAILFNSKYLIVNTTLFNSNANIKFLQYSLEYDITLLIDWFKTNQLLLNINKTVLVKFSSEGKSFSIDLNDLSLSNIKSKKFLGIMVDETLCWDEHVHQLKSKLIANKYLLAMSKNLDIWSLHLGKYALYEIFK